MAECIQVRESVYPHGVSLLRLAIPPRLRRLPPDWSLALEMVALPQEPGPEALVVLRDVLGELMMRPVLEVPPFHPRLAHRRTLLLRLLLASPQTEADVGWGTEAGSVVLYNLRLKEPVEAGGLDDFLRRARKLALFVSRRGRPMGSGTFPDREAALSAFREAARAVRDRGQRPTQERVALELADRGLTAAIDPLETLKSWLRRYRIEWAELMAD